MRLGGTGGVGVGGVLAGEFAREALLLALRLPL